MKKSFILYKDLREIFDELPDEQAGKLIKSVFAYCDGEEPEIKGLLKVAFIPIKNHLKRDMEKWKTKSEKAKKAANARWNTEENEDADGCERMQTHSQAMHSDARDAVSVSVNVSDSDSVSVNESEKNTITSSGNDELEKIKSVWNDFAEENGLCTVRALSDKRKKAIRARAKEKAFDLPEIFKKIESSDFLKGKKTSWKVDFDFIFCSASNYLKILEGNYNVEKNSGFEMTMEDYSAVFS